MIDLAVVLRALGTGASAVHTPAGSMGAQQIWLVPRAGGHDYASFSADGARLGELSFHPAGSDLRRLLVQRCGGPWTEERLVPLACVPAAVRTAIERRVAERERVRAAVVPVGGCIELPRGERHRHLLHRAEDGIESIHLGHRDEVTGRALVDEENLDDLLDRCLTLQDAGLPVVLAEPLRSSLAAGLARYRDALGAIERGEAGFRMHVGMLVTGCAGSFFNVRFAGERVGEVVRLAPAGPANLRSALRLSAARDELGVTVQAISPAARAALCHHVAAVLGDPDVLFGLLAAGAVSVGGGGPTSEDTWTLIVDGARFVRMRATGEEEVVDEADVRALLARRGWHTVRGI